MADATWVEKLRVADLRRELRQRGESGTGRKAELVERLKRLLGDSQVGHCIISAQVGDGVLMGSAEWGAAGIP